MDKLQLAANIATALGFFVLAWQVYESRKATKVQTMSNELQSYTVMNLEFLNIISCLGEHINDPKTRESDLSHDEKRAIDRYFYLANMEYILYKQNIIGKKMADQWIRGISSAVKKQPFVDRWNSTASKFSLDDDFRKFLEQEITKY